MTRPLNPSRIVCLQPSATVILASIGQLDRVVACTRYCAAVVPAVANGNRQIVADSWTAQAGEILAAKPDLVIAAVPYQEKAVNEILRAGIRFLGLAPRTLADIYCDIATIAGIVGEHDRGVEVIEGMQATIAEFASAAPLNHRPRVFCEEWGNPLIASQPWVAELVEAAGGQFVLEPGKRHAAQLVAREDPDVLIAAWCGASDRVPLEKIVRSRGWAHLNAVRDRQVYCIKDEYLNTPAPTLLRGLHCLAAALHPDQFSAPEGLRRITEVCTDPA